MEKSNHPEAAGLLPKKQTRLSENSAMPRKRSGKSPHWDFLEAPGFFIPHFFATYIQFPYFCRQRNHAL